MMKSVGLLTVMIFVSLFAFGERRDCKSTCSGEIEFVADSVDFREDLWRLYGRIVGKPHTSGRIDTISGNALDGSLSFVAEDIDGVDFGRWFQWEDDGNIALEIDFPALKPVEEVVLRVVGPKGDSEWRITTKARKNKE